MADKKVPSLDAAIGATVGMVRARQGEEFEDLAGLNECVGYAIGRLRWYIVIGLSYHQQEGAAQLPCVGHVGLFIVVFSNGVAHPLFVPPLFVDTIVVTAAGGDGGLIKVAVEEEAAEGILAARGGAIEPDPGGVNIGVLGSQGLYPEDPVGEAGVGNVLPADVVKGF